MRASMLLVVPFLAVPTSADPAMTTLVLHNSQMAATDT
jgi:hypothetical protein